ncbi:uncharacterized protein F5147DRAFT_748926 [Suillus discolor]|uniref:Uncharacterized protein n=1 Tax=Suillus discolor TaxID=1912936 RepID=A0A9P7ERD4_9AGAM|nr:uncharacterized protein F5147DRAFT_748926 [Suillus discolor]KAG2083330.1 hypothetical protein F5147DRAFT_748926 [Suillus discolor]
MPICEGCCSVFTESGYSHHLAQTTNPSCVNIYEEMHTCVASDSPEQDGDIKEENDEEGDNKEENDEEVDNNATGDGIVRRGHPLVACYIGDYPEQLLVTGMKTGECPKCDIPSMELGSKDHPFELRDLDEILDALALADEHPTQFGRACRDAGMKPLYHPFWEELPHCNIYHTITPDVLHQLYQGPVKHLIAWIKSACGEAEIDARCKWLPPNHNIHLFMKGISQICQFLLGIILDICLPDNTSTVRLVHAVLGILDFLYLAQYPSIFVNLGIRASFNLPKLHSFQHYKIMWHDKFIQWQLRLQLNSQSHHPLHHSDIIYSQQLKVAKHPSIKRVPLASLAEHYVACFIVQVMHPNLTARQSEDAACDITLLFQSVSVFHKVHYGAVHDDGSMVNNDTVDTIHTWPVRHDGHDRRVPARFDTALINLGNGNKTGVEGYRVAQVRFIFALLANVKRALFHKVNVPDHLAYIEWFTPFPATPNINHGMYSISRALQDGERQASIIPVRNICHLVHLIPKFGAAALHDWTMSNVLDQCSIFFVNNFTDRHVYVTIL